MSVTIRGRFRRSVHLARDFFGEPDLSGYVVTAKAREMFGRIADALDAEEAQRAWSVTGPYGGGKSAFALFLAHLLRGSSAASDHLADLDPTLTERIEVVADGAFCPVLVVGSREPLGPVLLRGLAEGLRRFAEREAGEWDTSPDTEDFGAMLRGIAEEAETAAEASDGERTLALFERAAEAVRGTAGGGLLVVVDELGKLLEYAALYPERSDLFVLQQLAERASRTEAGAPILLFTILHQAFERYAGRLGQTQREEWQKVQGRFEDVAFVEPPTETLRVLAQAVRTKGGAGAPQRALVAEAYNHITLPASVDAEWAEQQLRSALPLHPAVALLVGPLFRRLAQNERSLFAFLASGEPHSFIEVVEAAERGGLLAPLYRLDHLYDYLVANLSAGLSSEAIGMLWAETEAALAMLASRGAHGENADALQARLVKHTALLGFAGALAGMSATPATLAWTADAPADDVRAALQDLREARVVTHRPLGDTVHVWQGSDFDLDAALREARARVPLRTPLADLLARALPPTPLVARRHSHRTGTLRVFQVQYVSDQTWRAAAKKPLKKTDGRVLYVLPETDDSGSLLADLAGGLGHPLVFAAVPDGVGALREAARDLACLDWVRERDAALEGDAVARREVAEQRAALAAEVERLLATLLLADERGINPCTWVAEGQTFRLDDERALQRTLSAACDRVFAETPAVWNELLNRRKPSGSAVRGLKLLLDAMLRHESEPRLGIDGTPAEYGLYASILQASGIHRQDDEGRWHFGRPDADERPGCAAVWDALAEMLREAGGRPVPIRALYARLSAPPYGVRPGLIPVFLFAFLAHARDEMAVYESGTFVRALTFETIERLLKSQEKGRDTFAMQWVEIGGERGDVLARLAPMLGVSASATSPLPIAIRLLGHVHDLPPFVRHTADLSEGALAVRGALERATDPTALVFETLPEACGVSAFIGSQADGQTGNESDRAERFARHLQDALRELGGAYDALLAWIGDRLAEAFRLRADAPDERRYELAARAHRLLPATTDLRRKAFLVRATDETLDAKGWTESLAALVADRSPTQWTDENRAHFTVALAKRAAAFTRLDGLADDLAKGSPIEGLRRVRLSVQTLSETERDGVIHIHPEDEALYKLAA